MGEDRGQQRAHLPWVDPLLARLLEMDAEPEVVLDLDEQVGEPDRVSVVGCLSDGGRDGVGELRVGAGVEQRTPERRGRFRPER